MRIRVRRLARDDIDSSFTWYLERDRNAASRFLDDIEQVMNRVAVNPHQFPDVYRGARRALLKHFPYALYFRVDEDAAVVLAVVHQRRFPNSWKRRT